MNWIKRIRQAIAGGTLIIAPFSWFLPGPPPGKPDIEIQELSIRGQIEGENVTFTLTFEADVNRKNVQLPLVQGPVSYLEAKLPKGAELSRDGDSYALKFTQRGRQSVTFSFASLAAKTGDWRETSFALPAATVRRLFMACDRDDLEIQFPGALNIERTKVAGEKALVSAFLATGQNFAVRWKPEVRKLDAELVVACDANTIAVARVGALQLDTVFTYRVVQGSLTKLSLVLPKQLNVTQVRGIDIREWNIDKPANGPWRLLVTLNRPKDKLYLLDVEGEMALPAFPCKFELPFILPENAIRTSGFLMLGADSAIKLLVNKAAGLTQVDQAAFPRVQMEADAVRALPSRSAYAYQYANLPCQMELAADDIVTGLYSDERFVLSLENNSLALQGAIELDIRDAPTRDVTIKTDPRWIVANVAGKNLADYDVRDKDGSRLIQVYFREAVTGRVLLDVRLEHSLEDAAKLFEAPLFQVQGAKAERGYIVFRAEQGIRLKAETVTGLREVNIGSLPTRVTGAQSAFRFKDGTWTAKMTIEKADPSVHAETFHLIALGENALYGSCSITYNIGSAPVKAFRVKVPSKYQHVEFTGRDVRGPQQEGDIYTIALQEKVSGDYTLLVTYDQPLAYGGDQILVGAVQPLDTETEVGYIALTGAARLAFDQEIKRDPSILPLNEGELPKEYALLINAPVLRAYKFVSPPHEATVSVKRYATQPLLDQVADHMTLSTRISEAGEAVTEAAYFVKNTSGQYLEVKLPAGAKLWSVNVDDQKVQVLDGPSGSVLIPVERRRDPNQPLKINLVYAEQQKQSGLLRRLVFRAPVTVARSVFADWTLQAPKDFVAVPLQAGNMFAPQFISGGLGRLCTDVLDICRAIGTRGTGWLALGVVGLLPLFVLVRNLGRRRLFAFSTWMSLLVALFALILVVRFAGFAWTFWNGLGLETGIPAHSQTIQLTKPVTLADSELKAALVVMPHWLALTADWVRGAVGTLACGIFVGWALRRQRGAWLLFAFGILCLLWGVSAFPNLVPLLALLVVLCVPFSLFSVVARRAYVQGLRRQADDLLLALEEPPPPAPSAPPAPPPLSPAPAPTPAGRTAVVSLLLGLGLLGGLAANSARAANAAPEPPPPEPVMKTVEMTIEAPNVPTDLNRNARIKTEVEFEVKKPVDFSLLPKPFVLTDYTADSRNLEVAAGSGGYVVKVLQPGTYRVTVSYLAPVVERDGAWRVQVWVPPHLQNHILLKVPSGGWDVQSPQAVSVKTAEVEGRSESHLIAGPVSAVEIVWQPRERKTELEKAVFFCETNTYVLFQPGLVNLSHVARYQIAQGELQSLLLQIPAGMNVTAVSGPGISTWRFDPETRQLEALLEKPVSGEYALTVVTQMPREALPYSVDLAAPTVQSASRQRGSLALAATEAVQIRVDEMTGLTAMNVGDFAPETFAAAQQGKPDSAPPEIKRAFRYQQLPVTVKVSAERVLPEVRIVEEATVDVSDERTVLSSHLQATVTKSGIFSLRLDVPDAFDVESLTGDDISHWDEVKEEGHGVIVNFTKQVTGMRNINLVLSRMEKGLSPTLDMPRVTVRDAFKHTGTLAVSGERGVRFTATDREGVTEINPREIGIEQPGYLAFRLLRPNWKIVMKTEAMAPVVKADILQRVEVSEGMQVARCFLQYSIEHAGVKLFRLQAPQPGVALTVAGRNTARVQEMDKKEGVWEIELNNKVEREYALEVSYQIPFDHSAKEVRVRPLKALGSEAQKGYLVVFAGGRLRVQPPPEVPTGLHAEDSRGVPARFNAGDLSGAILCYRTTTPDYALTLSVIRHGAADVLPAKVSSLRLTSVVASDDQMLTQAVMQLQLNSLRFLDVNLPAGNSLWSVFVNGKAVVPLVEKKTFLIPLEAGGNGASTVEFMYGGAGASRLLARRHVYEGPSFNLPLADIQWDFYLPPDVWYYGFGGTLLPRQGKYGELVTFSADQYTAENKEIMVENQQKAEQVLERGNQLWQEGQQVEARQAMQSAIAYSQGQKDLNEDARIQFRNLAKQQAVVGLANRRIALKKERNTADEAGLEQLKGFNQGNWNAEYGKKMEQYLGTKENDSLNVVAEKIIDQQAAAEAEVHPIRITMPIQGKHLAFYRELQIKPHDEMRVEFRAGAGWQTKWGYPLLVGVGFLLLFWLLTRLTFGPQRA